MNEISEGNKLIAEFMQEENISAIFQTEPFVTEVRISYNMIDKLEKQGAEVRLYYHDNWNKLMPVVEKIESIYDDHHGYFGVHISSNSCSIQGTNLWKAIKEGSNYGAVYMSDPNAILNTKIESTWYNIVQFITWYNTQSK